VRRSYGGATARLGDNKPGSLASPSSWRDREENRRYERQLRFRVAFGTYRLPSQYFRHGWDRDIAETLLGITPCPFPGDSVEIGTVVLILHGDGIFDCVLSV
jgi:hypothetical protein